MYILSILKHTKSQHIYKYINTSRTRNKDINRYRESHGEREREREREREYICICIHIYVCVQISYICIYIYMCVKRTYNSYIYIYICIYIYTYTLRFTYISIYTLFQKFAQSQRFERHVRNFSVPATCLEHVVRNTYIFPHNIVVGGTSCEHGVLSSCRP